MTTPSVSVLVTVYNREKYLGACLDSILASTFGDFEVVIVDDCSTDRSAEIAMDAAASDSRIRFHRNDANLGDYPNRTKAANLASGSYLKYVDSDDLIYPHGLQVMVDGMHKFPDAALGISHSLPEDDQPYPWRLAPKEAWRKEFLAGGCMGSGPTGAIIRRDAFFEVGGFRDWGVLNDTDLWYRLSARWPLLLLPPGLVWWRRHDAQEFTSNGAAITYLEKGFQMSAAALKSQECPLSKEDAERALARVRHRHARRLLSLGLRNGHPRMALDLMKKSGLSAREILSGFTPYH